jgi:hypothetical protein
MKTSLKCTSPDEILYTITVTATAREFKQLRDDSVIPYALSLEISNLLIQANQTFETNN